MKILAVYSIKGGVGKTATAVNLSYLSAEAGLRTLIVDLDPQSSATFYFRVKPKLKHSTRQLISGKKAVDKNIKGTDFYNLDLLPADFSLRNLDLQLDELKRSKKRLSEMLAPLSGEYDVCILDCPPNITLVSENLFYAADKILVPVIPTTLSELTFTKLHKFFKQNDLPKSKLLAFFSMFESRKSLHNQIMSDLPGRYSILTARIPYSSDVEKMGLTRDPVIASHPQSRAAQAYDALWAEVKEKLL